MSCAYHKSLSDSWAFAFSCPQPPSAWNVLPYLDNSKFWFGALVGGQGLHETLP